MAISAEILKAARAMLGWKSLDLAEHSGVAHDTIRSFESGRTRTLTAMNEKAVIRALEQAGLVLIAENGGGAGVRFESPKTQEVSDDA